MAASLRRLLFLGYRHYNRAVRHCKRKVAPMPCSFAAKLMTTGHVFLASSCLTPNRDLLYLIRNKVDY